MAYIIILPDPDWRHRCRHRGGDPDCACYPECPECGALYTPSEGHDCIDSELSKCDLLDIARELRDKLDAYETERDRLRAELDAAHDGEDALRSEVARLRAQIEALQSVPQGVEVEVPRWEDVDAKFQAGEPRNPLDDFVHSNEPAIDDEDGTCADEVFRAELKAAIDWVTARLVPTPIKPIQPEERRVGPDEVVVGREELDALNRATSHARQYIESDRMEKREWKGWTLDEFDQAIEDLDALRTSAQAPGQRGEG